MSIDLSDIEINSLVDLTQLAQQDVDKYDSKDKIDESKHKAEKQSIKEQNKLLQDIKKSESKTFHNKNNNNDNDNNDDRILQLKKKIKEYETNKILGPHLTKSGFKFDKALSKDSVDKLERQITKIEKLLSGKTADDGVNTGIKVVMTGLERMISTKTDADITGLTQCCFEDNQWLFLLERVKMKYGFKFRR